MKHLVCAALVALACPAYAAPSASDVNKIIEAPTDANLEAFDGRFGGGAAREALTPLCVWGKPAYLLSRMPAGRAGFDALLVRRPNEQAPFFVMMKRGLPLSAACRI